MTEEITADELHRLCDDEIDQVYSFLPLSTKIRLSKVTYMTAFSELTTKEKRMAALIAADGKGIFPSIVSQHWTKDMIDPPIPLSHLYGDDPVIFMKLLCTWPVNVFDEIPEHLPIDDARSVVYYYIMQASVAEKAAYTLTMITQRDWDPSTPIKDAVRYPLYFVNSIIEQFPAARLYLWDSFNPRFSLIPENIEIAESLDSIRGVEKHTVTLDQVLSAVHHIITLPGLQRAATLIVDLQAPKKNSWKPKKVKKDHSLERWCGCRQCRDVLVGRTKKKSFRDEHSW